MRARIVAKYKLAIDDAVRRALDDPANESCKPDDAAFARAHFELIARPKQSLDAAVKLAKEAATRPSISAPISKARRARSQPITRRLALQARAQGKRLAILSGGELTVTVRGNGRGGPNQEYALALTGLLKDTPDISALAGDTDGADGGAGHPTDPAGALIDAATFAKMQALAPQPQAYLDNNDATTFFEATGDLLMTGPDADERERYQGDLGGLRRLPQVSLSFPATARRLRGVEVQGRRSFSEAAGGESSTPRPRFDHKRLGVLDRPVKPGDDSRASKLVRDLREHPDQGFAVGLPEQLVQPGLVLGGDELFRPGQHGLALVGQHQDVRAAVVGGADPRAEVAALQIVEHRHEVRAQDAQRRGDLGLVTARTAGTPIQVAASAATTTRTMATTTRRRRATPRTAWSTASAAR